MQMVETYDEEFNLQMFEIPDFLQPTHVPRDRFATPARTNVCNIMPRLAVQPVATHIPASLVVFEVTAGEVESNQRVVLYRQSLHVHELVLLIIVFL